MKLRDVGEDEEKATQARATAQAAASLLRAWDGAAERERIARGQGLPANVKPAQDRKLKRDKATAPRLVARSPSSQPEVASMPTAEASNPTAPLT